MGIEHFVGILHKDSDSEYGVSFPDFPGCVTAGKTLDEAKNLAIEALEFHVEGLLEEGIDIPLPTELEKIVQLKEYKDAEFFLTIPVTITRAKSKRINITLPEDLIRIIDKFSRKKGLSRSAFLAKASEIAIQRNLIKE